MYNLYIYIIYTCVLKIQCYFLIWTKLKLQIIKSVLHSLRLNCTFLNIRVEPRFKLILLNTPIQ